MKWYFHIYPEITHDGEGDWSFYFFPIFALSHIGGYYANVYYLEAAWLVFRITFQWSNR